MTNVDHTSTEGFVIGLLGYVLMSAFNIIPWENIYLGLITGTASSIAGYFTLKFLKWTAKLLTPKSKQTKN